MSDEKDSKPMKKTSAVPLRKETVRVTLKVIPEDSKAPAAPAGAPRPPAPAPTIPLKTSGPGTAKPPAPAPTVRLKAGSVTKPATPAPTVRLNTPTTGPGTVPLAGVGAAGGTSSQPLPKATVQLKQTQPMGSPATPSQAATIRTADDDDDSDQGEGAASALSVVALIAALIVLGVQLATANIWVADETRTEAPGWGRLFE